MAIKGTVRQSKTEVGGEGDPQLLTSTRLGQLFTANWKEKMLFAGKLYRITIGAFTADTDILQVQGGGGSGGSTLELEKPQIAVGVGSGYRLFLAELNVSVQSDQDADGDYMRIVAIMDRTLSVPTSVTGTIETPANMLDGGPSFLGTAYSNITTDIADPTMSELLAYKTNTAYQISAAGTIVSGLDLEYEPEIPSIGDGPCSIHVYWGGTIATLGLATMVVGVVPQSWVKFE